MKKMFIRTTSLCTSEINKNGLSQFEVKEALLLSPASIRQKKRRSSVFFSCAISCIASNTYKNHIISHVKLDSIDQKSRFLNKNNRCNFIFI